MITDQSYPVAWRLYGRILFEAEQAALAELGRLADRPPTQRSWELLSESERTVYYYMALTMNEAMKKLGRLPNDQWKRLYRQIHESAPADESAVGSYPKVLHRSFIDSITGN